MVEVYQTNFENGKGNCLAACIASVLELPLETVPDLGNVIGWQQKYADWLAKFGLAWITCPVDPKTRAEHFPFLFPGYTLMGVLSPRFAPALHSVVALNGKIIHDPNPDYDRSCYLMERGDIVDATYFIALQPQRLIQ